MELTGVIVAAIVAASLLYLIPSLLRQRASQVDSQPELPFGSTMRTIHVAEPQLAIDDSLFVSTPYTRRAQVRELRRQQEWAARRRRWAFLACLAILAVLVGTSAAGATAWWSLAVPGGLLLAVLAMSRLTVRVLDRRHADRHLEINTGDDFTDTICFAAIRERKERQVEIATPVEVSGSLWDPVPVTVPTYVQKPLAPRTVRTIDLSAPELPAASQHRFPPTADAPVAAAAANLEQLDLAVAAEAVHLRAVGE